MKKSIILTGLLIIASALPSFAAGPYVGASGGVSFIHDNDVKVTGVGTATAQYKTGYGVDIQAGYNFEPVRVEFEFGYKNADMDKLTALGRSASVKDTDVTIMSYMVNGLFDIKNSSPFTPFIGAGIGILNGELKSSGDKDDDTVFGYQFKVGGAYALSKNVDLNLYYKFQGAASDFSKNGVSFSYTSSNIYGGLRYNF
ncbi:MAG TPA: outer membrane beta-barrel protein [Desulfuromonadaceae bacterium]|jgi:opacity protein-like surface antigen